MKTLLTLPFAVPIYYWTHRVQLWESFIDEIPFVHRPEAQSVEIWLSADRSRSGDRWVAKLPARCVTCGEWGNENETMETRKVDEYSTPALTAFLGLLVGALSSYLMTKWKYQFSIWAFPAGLLLGFLFGYLLKDRSEVVLRYYRCRRHLGDRKLPRLRVFGDHLIVRVGNKEVRKDFREPEKESAGF